MISAIILAAGASRRMGRQKLLLPHGEATVIEHIARQVIASKADETVVVTGHDHEAVSAAVAGLPVIVFRNPDPSRGMLSSVRRGIAAASPDADALLVALGDQPGIQKEIIDHLIETFPASGKEIAVPLFGGRRGHPLLFSARYREEIATRFDDTGLRGLLAAHPDEVAEIPVTESSVLEDIDTPEDYARFLGGPKSSGPSDV